VTAAAIGPGRHLSLPGFETSPVLKVDVFACLRPAGHDFLLSLASRCPARVSFGPCHSGQVKMVGDDLATGAYLYFSRGEKTSIRGDCGPPDELERPSVVRVALGSPPYLQCYHQEKRVSGEVQTVVTVQPGRGIIVRLMQSSWATHLTVLSLGAGLWHQTGKFDCRAGRVPC